MSSLQQRVFTKKLTATERKDPRASLEFVDRGLYVCGIGKTVAEIEQEIADYATRFGFDRTAPSRHITLIQSAIGWLNQSPGKPQGFNFSLEGPGLMFRRGGQVINSEYSWHWRFEPHSNWVAMCDVFEWHDVPQTGLIPLDRFSLGDIVLCMKNVEPSESAIPFDAGYLIRSDAKNAKGHRAVKSFAGEVLNLNEWTIVSHASEVTRHCLDAVRVSLYSPSIKQYRALPPRELNLLAL